MSCSSFYFCRWWWAILTLWLLPDRTLSRNRRNWKSCPNTTPEQSDWASNSNTSTLSQEQRPAVLKRNSCWTRVPVGWVGLVWRVSTHLSCQKTGSTPIWTLKFKENGTGHEQIFWMLQHSQQMDKIFPLTTSSKPATVYSEHFSPSRVVLPKNPFLFCNTAKHSFFHVSCLCLCCSIWDDKVVTVQGCYSRTLSLFPLRAFQRPIFHICAFFYMYVQDMEVLFVLFRGSVHQSWNMTLWVSALHSMLHSICSRL